MASRWSGQELGLFEHHIRNNDWLRELRAALPHRTIHALRLQMTKLRRDRGILSSKEAWQPHERKLFEEYIDDDNWFVVVKAAFPSRTEMALKVQMSALRRASGRADGREVDASWMVAARIATQMLGEATKRVGMWS